MHSDRDVDLDLILLQLMTSKTRPFARLSVKHVNHRDFNFRRKFAFLSGGGSV
jgi:hypothetical protein